MTRLRYLIAASFLVFSVSPVFASVIDVTSGTVSSLNISVPGYAPLTSFHVELVYGDTPLQFWDGVNILKNQTVFVPPPGQILLYATNADLNTLKLVFPISTLVGYSGGPLVGGTASPDHLISLLYGLFPPDDTVFSNNNPFLSNLSLTIEPISAVPSPLAGAGLPGILLAILNLFAWWRRSRSAARSNPLVADSV